MLLAAATEMFTVEVAVFVKYVAVIVYVSAAISFCGVPEITPVVVSRLSPWGRSSEIEYVGVPPNPAGVKGAVGVIAVP